MNVFSSAMEL